MDGFKKQLGKKQLASSIQFKLSLWIAVIIAGMAVLAVVAAYYTVLHETSEIQDKALQQIAGLIFENKISQNQISNTLNNNVANESRVFIQPLEPLKDSPYLQLPAKLNNGFHTLDIENKTYRILVVDQRMAILQSTQLRDDAAQSAMLSTLVPLLLLLPLLIGLACWFIRKSFKPMAALSTEITHRKEQDLMPLSTAHLPAEIQPFVVEINHLFERVAQSMTLQKRFIADAAHELRTPLTALRLQANRLAALKLSAAAQQQLAKLTQGIERNSHLIDQLLSFTRAQAPLQSLENRITAQQIYAHVLEDLLPLAESKNIDIGVKPGVDIALNINETDIIMVIKNLVDNAIRYTPANGRIDLSAGLQASRLLFEIEDNGPGIAASEHQLVFDPFYRVLGNEATGSGLGLAIVKATLEKLGGEITLANSPNFATGLKVSVYLPASYLA